MTNTDFKEFSDLMDEAGHAFLVKVSGHTKEVYFAYLKLKNISEVEKAITQHIITGESFPSISSLLNKIDSCT